MSTSILLSHRSGIFFFIVYGYLISDIKVATAEVKINDSFIFKNFKTKEQNIDSLNIPSESNVPHVTLDTINVIAVPDIRIKNFSADHLIINKDITLTTPTTSELLLADPQINVQPYIKDGGSSFGINIQGFNLSTAYLNDLPDIGRLYQRDSSTLEAVKIIQGATAITHSSGSLGGYVNQTLKAPSFKENSLQLGQIFTYFPQTATLPISKASTGYTRQVHDLNLIKSLSANTDLAVRLSGAWQKGGNASGLDRGKHVEIFGFAVKHQTHIAKHQFNFWSDYQRSKQPFDFGTIISNGVPLYDYNFTDHTQPIKREYERQQFAYQADFKNWQVNSGYANSRVNRTEGLNGFWTKADEITLKNYQSQIQDNYKQQDARIHLKLQKQFRINNQPIIFSQNTVLQTHQHNYKLTGDQSIDGYRFDIDDENWRHQAIDLQKLDKRLKRLTYKNKSVGYQNTINHLPTATSLILGIRRTNYNIKQQPRLALPFKQLDKGAHNNYEISINKKSFDHWQTSLTHSNSSKPNLAMAKNGEFLKSKRLSRNSLRMQYDDSFTQASINLFHQQLNNLIKRDPNDRNFFILDGNAKTYGTNINYKTALNNSTDLQFGYQYLNTKDQFNQPFIGLAKNKFYFNIFYKGLMNDLPMQATLKNKYISKRCLANNKPCVEPALISDIHAKTKFNNKLIGYLGINNIFNKKTVADFNSENSVYRYPSRNIYIGLNYSFF